MFRQIFCFTFYFSINYILILNYNANFSGFLKIVNYLRVPEY